MQNSNIALGNLRAIIIMIVVAFHASLAYLDYAPTGGTAFDQAPYRWEAFPIVDTHRWLGLDVFCAWQDVSLMSLLFFLAGLFAVGSLLRKGIRGYVTGRLWRIGLPFLLAIIFLSPLSFYPAYLVRSSDPSITDFGQQWISLSSWPSGPQWFLWQLLVVNLLAAALYAVTPSYVQRLGHLAEWVGGRPARLFALLVVASVLAYFPLALSYSPWTWGSVGPFGLQLCRPAHYVVYFFTGVALGHYGLDRGLLACDGPLARNWLAMLAAAVVGFGAWAGLTSFTMPDWDKAGIAAQVAASLAFPFACAGGSLSLLAICLRFGRKRRWVLDSLSTNAYSIYLLHYVFILWLQYALLESELFALAKAMIVFGAALIMSWAASIGFNRLLSGSALVTVKRAISPLPR